MRPVHANDSLVNDYPLSRFEGWDLLDLSRARRSATESGCLLVPLKAPMVGVIVEVRPRRPSVAKRDRGVWYWMPCRKGWVWRHATLAVYEGGGCIKRECDRWKPCFGGERIVLRRGAERILATPFGAMKVVEAAAAASREPAQAPAETAGGAA